MRLATPTQPGAQEPTGRKSPGVPSGTFGGAAIGIVTGATFGASGGWIGTLIGAGVGAFLGVYTGRGIAEVTDPTIEETFWKENARLKSHPGKW